MVCGEALRSSSERMNFAMAFSTMVAPCLVMQLLDTPRASHSCHHEETFRSTRDLLFLASRAPSLAGDAPCRPYSADPAPGACTPASSRCRRGLESSVPYADRRRFQPCASRSCAAAYADWRGATAPTRRLPSATRAAE